MFPFNCTKSKFDHQCNCLVPSPTRSWYTIVSKNSMYLMETTDFLETIIGEFSFQANEWGPNVWCKWIKNSIFIGTFTGDIYVIRVLDYKFFVVSKEIHLGKLISCAFLFEGYVGVCFSGPKIVLFTDSLNNVPYLWEIGFNDKISMKEINLKNIEFIKTNGKIVFLLTENGVIYKLENDEVKEIENLGLFVNSVQFIDESNLLVIGNNGLVVVYSFELNQKFEVLISDARCLIDSFYCLETKTLYFISQENILEKINFLDIIPPFGVSSTYIYNILNQYFVCEIPDENDWRKIRTIPDDLFPIKKIIVNNEDTFCIVGHNGISIFTKYSLFFEQNINPDFIVWINLLLFIVIDNVIYLYSDGLSLIGSYQIKYKPISVTSYKTKSLLVFKDEILIFEFDTSNQTKFIGESHNVKIGSFELVIYKIKIQMQVKNAYILWNNDIYLHLFNNKVIKFESSEVIWNDAKYVWVNESPLLLCCLNNDFVDVYSDVHSGHYSYKTKWSYDTSLLKISQKQILEKFIIEKIDFSTHLIPTLKQDSTDCGETLIKLHNESNFAELFADFMSKLKENYQLSLFYQGLNEIDPKIIPDFLVLMTDEQLKDLAGTNFNFVPYFPSVKQSTQSRILNHIQPVQFQEIIDKYQNILEAKMNNFKDFIVNKFIENGKFIKCCLFSNAAGIDFCELIKNSNIHSKEIKDCLDIMESDFLQWKSNDKDSLLRLIGCSFQLSKINQWALACFLILKDHSKIKSILLDDPDTMFSAMSFTLNYKNNYYAQYLKSMKIGL